MLINLTDYFEVVGKDAKISVPFEADVLDNDYQKYPIEEKEDCVLHVVNVGNGKLTLEGSMNVTLKGSCDRCLEDVKIFVPVEFNYTVAKPDGFHELEEDQDLFMDGYMLDAETLIYNELIMSLPMKVLCKDDCKGLCPVCGSNRNVKECGCDTFVPDPRLAAITDIFNANKEV